MLRSQVKLESRDPAACSAIRQKQQAREGPKDLSKVEDLKTQTQQLEFCIWLDTVEFGIAAILQDDRCCSVHSSRGLGRDRIIELMWFRGLPDRSWPVAHSSSLEKTPAKSIHFCTFNLNH